MTTEKRERRKRSIAEQRKEHVERIARCKAATEKAEADLRAWEIGLRAKHEAALKELSEAE